MPPRKPGSARYVVEIRDAAGTSLLLTSADWTAKERDSAVSAVLRLAAAPATRQTNKRRSDEKAPRAKSPRKT
jgi:hypothetical protein